MRLANALFFALDKESREGFVIASASYLHGAFGFVMLEHVVADFVQEDLLQHEIAQCARRPGDNGGARMIGDFDERAGAFKRAADLRV